MAAYQQQDPDPLRLDTPLLAASGGGLRVRTLHGDRIGRLCTCLFPERHPLTLQGSKTSHLPVRSDSGYRPSRSPIVLLDRQGPDNQFLQHRNPDGPARTRTDRNRILHSILTDKTQTPPWTGRDETEELHYDWNRAGNSGTPRREQIRNDGLNNATHGSQTRAGLPTILSRLHSRLTRSVLRNSTPQQVPG